MRYSDAGAHGCRYFVLSWINIVYILLLITQPPVSYTHLDVYKRREIRSIIERYETLLQQDEYDIRFEYREDVIIQGDVIKLDQVIYNLINNCLL